MNWYYVDQGKQAGPVNDAQLEQMRLSGTIQDDTLIWREGMANWEPYRNVKAAATTAPVDGSRPPAPFAAPSANATEAVCAECGNLFSKENMIRYGSNWVCATCKPVFMQKLAEGVVNPAGRRGAVTEADLLERDYDVDIGDSVSKGWEAFKNNSGILIGASVLVYIILVSVNLLNFLHIPFLSVIIGFFLTGPLSAGLWVIFIKSVRGQAIDIGDAFSGFGPRYWQLVLVALIPTLLTLGVMFMFGIVAAVLIPGFAAARHSAFSPVLSTAVAIPFAIFVFAAIVALIYITVCWRFALPLVIDKKLKFWPALQLSRQVVTKHWWGTFALYIVIGLLATIGALACLVGVLVTAPLAFAAWASHYDKVFGDLAPEQD